MNGPWFSALRERVEESYAAPILSRAEALALLDIAEAAQEVAVLYDNPERPRSPVVTELVAVVRRAEVDLKTTPPAC